MRLVLGVLDVGYSDAHGKSGATSTGEVAEILEKKYDVMGTFFEVHREKIGNLLAQAIGDEIADMASGKAISNNPFSAAESGIESEFRSFLSRDEMSQLVAGLSDAERGSMGSRASFGGAASRGVSHRKKSPNAKKNKSRPAFIDTGLYQASFRAQVDDTKD